MSSVKIIMWRITKKGEIKELDYKLWAGWILWSGARVGAATVVKPVLSAWAIKLLIFFIIYKSLRWIFDAFEIPILGSIASLSLIVIAFNDLILAPLHKADEFIDKINHYSSFWDKVVNSGSDELDEFDAIKENRAKNWEGIKNIYKTVKVLLGG